MSKIKELKDYAISIDENDLVAETGTLRNLCKMISRLPDESPKTEKWVEAVEFDFKFLHWIFDNHYSRYWGSDGPNNKKWYKGYTMPDRKYYTDLELYNLYKSV